MNGGIVEDRMAEQAEAERSRAMDPEIRTMGNLLRLVETVPEPGRRRVVEWLYSRYCQGAYDDDRR